MKRLRNAIFGKCCANFGEIPCGAHNFGKSADSVVHRSLKRLSHKRSQEISGLRQSSATENRNIITQLLSLLRCQGSRQDGAGYGYVRAHTALFKHTQLCSSTRTIIFLHTYAYAKLIQAHTALTTLLASSIGHSAAAAALLVHAAVLCYLTNLFASHVGDVAAAQL